MLETLLYHLIEPQRGFYSFCVCVCVSFVPTLVLRVAETWEDRKLAGDGYMQSAIYDDFPYNFSALSWYKSDTHSVQAIL
jgi:hypothetical protein